MKVISALMILAGCGCGCCACTTTKFAPTGQTYAPYTGAVSVLKTPPIGPAYEEIGLVSCHPGLLGARVDYVGPMQRKAAHYGANAIILSPLAAPQSGRAPGQPARFVATRPGDRLVGIAIRIRPGAEQPEP